MMCLPVRMSVSLHGYLQNLVTDLQQLFLWMLPVTVVRSFFGSVAIRYALPVLWMFAHRGLYGADDEGHKHKIHQMAART